MRRHHVLTLPIYLLMAVTLGAAESGNLLRNGSFQDDWLTLLPQMKNHHWNYANDFYNRRDFNPDAWTCQGSWQWLDADKPMGQRRLVIAGPATIAQSVNWVAIHDDRQLAGFPDAGGYPVVKSVRMQRPDAWLCDLTFAVRVTGKDIPDGAGTIELAAGPASVSAVLPAGTYEKKIVEVKLSAAEFLQAAKTAAGKNPKEAAEQAKTGIELPPFVTVTIRCKSMAGSVEIHNATLRAAGPDRDNLLPHGSFETLAKDGYPAGWSKPAKYRYFPPRPYYIFNTWHNARFPNRGFVSADALMPADGARSLRMNVPSGDEMAVFSDPITLNQKEPRLIEVTARVMTDRLAMLQIDADTDDGQRLDGFNFIQKSPYAIGTDGWREIRQVFRPRAPVTSLRLALCARGVNGYTLDGTGTQPQNCVAGTIWWDKLTLSEPESTPKELEQRGVKRVPQQSVASGPHLTRLDLGERLLGENALRARLANFVPAGKDYALQWKITDPSGQTKVWSSKAGVIDGTSVDLEVPYTLTAPCPGAYSEYRGKLSLLQAGMVLATSELMFSTWTTPIDLRLGALYLRPEQKQFVRLNFGFTHERMQRLKSVKLDVVRRGMGQTLKSWTIDASPAAIAEQRRKIPADLRGDLANLLLTDLDVAFLPLQPFADPQRNWMVHASAIAEGGEVLATVDSPPFCRQGHDAPQPPIQSVAIKNRLVHINGQPWMPWGVTYGHNPICDGPADPGAGKYRDLHNLPEWSMYDRHNSLSSNRKEFDFNCLRYVAGRITKLDDVDKRWVGDNLYCSSAFAIPNPAFSLADLFKQAGGQDKLDAYLGKCGTSADVVSIAPGIEEAFGLFQGATPEQIQGLEQVVQHVRQKSGRPVMVGHGGYWNRLEFEKVPFFDIFDPETEPLFPANLHTDLTPLFKDDTKAIWLRPQMYESVPYERWRFHAYVELMRGCRGWQTAHGPGDSSLFRGLHGEMEFFKPIVASTDSGPRIDVEPRLEHWSRRHQGKTYVIAASTRGLPLGRFEWSDDAPAGTRRSRLTQGRDELSDESNAYGIGQKPESGVSIHGIQYLPDARTWPAGTKLVQWIKIDAEDAPKGIGVLIKGDGRWTHAATWGQLDFAAIRADPTSAYWFLNSFYRHAKGFLGWGMDLLPKSLDYIPAKAMATGAELKRGVWTKVEIALDKLGAANKLADGVAFIQDGGRVWWGRTSLIAPDGTETVLWGDATELPVDRLAGVKLGVAGLKAGVRIRVLFEDREIVAQDGYFTDDFRGQDLYQRHGGGAGYGNAPVALHLYEIVGP